MSMFTSGFAAKIDDMIDFRCAHGYKRETYLGSLIKFDRFCREHYPDSSELTFEIVHGWVDSENGSLRDNTGRITAIRLLGKYLCAIGENAYIMPEKFLHHKNSFMPYIFTDEELTVLFASIDNLPSDKREPYLSQIAPVLFRLIYTCGLRPNEGRELLCENVNLNTGELLITKTKKKKERIVVMSDEMLAMCRKYNLKRSIFGKNKKYFFPANNGEAYKSEKINAVFNKAWVTASQASRQSVPRSVRVYDLRHRFASACLNKWLDEGRNLMVMLPYLRAYMGHGTMNETAYYIHILPENLVKSAGVNWEAFNAVLPEVDA